MKGFGDGMALGVWQVGGSPGFVRLVRSFQPEWLGDIAAANAIYRPGPLGGGVHEAYANRKFGREEVSYPHELAEEALKETYGLIVYQEQIMALAKSMGGMTGGQADGLRKAISKEYRNGGKAHVKRWLKEKGYEDQWVDGCRGNSIKDAVIKWTWDQFIHFGDYGFNKSHAVVYAVQSYQDMWLKVNYPTEFYAALLTFDDELAMKVVRESRNFGCHLMPPDINKSGYGFSVDEDKIRFGLKAVRNMGDVGVKEVLTKQPFRSYEDFVERVTPRHCNKKAKESLVAAGAFDSFNMRKGWSPDERDTGEKENLGVKLTQAQNVSKYTDLIRSRITSETDFNELPDDYGITVGGEVTEKRETTVKRGKSAGKKMCFFTVQFDEHSYNCTLFADDFALFYDLVEEGKAVMIRGRKNVHGNKVGVIVDEMCSVEELAMALSTNTEQGE
jgi:DNA polymerase III alpha subunit